MKNQTIYVAELERFGYTLTAAGTNKGTLAKAIMAEYEEAYKNLNSEDPHEVFTYSDELSDYDTALEEIYIRPFAPNEVEWC